MPATLETLEKANKKRAGKAKTGARADAATSAETGEKPTLAQKRALKRKRMVEQNTVTFLLDTEVRKFVGAAAKAAGMDIAPFMQKMAETYVIENAPAEDPMARRIAAKRAVLDRAVELAREVDAEGGFDENFILTVVRKASSEIEFVDNYEIAVDAKTADDRALARAQAPINQQMGRLIKRAAGARSKRDANGKIMRGQIQNELITTYTLLEKA